MPAVDGDEGREADGRLTEIAENLHRREISQIERAGLVAEWVRIVDARGLQTAQLAQNESQRDDGRGHRRPGGKSGAARNLGMTRQTVERSLKVAALSPEAKEAFDAGYQSDTPPSSSRSWSTLPAAPAIAVSDAPL